jgi:hypothetical protein
MLRTLEATLDPAGKIQFVEDVKLTRRQRVLVTLLEDDLVESQPETQAGNIKQLLDLLALPRFRRRPYGSPKAMEATIHENRNGWADE